MRTLTELEAWARQHGAVLKVNFVEGVASLQVGGFIARTAGGVTLESALADLVSDLEQQMHRESEDGCSNSS
jgi:hypothetical protein